mmetsp:Transcript_60807/g.144075  ORF Transcript_60807/g.144075 Transcript_60807/m.144075 type:complete len:273 (-) Transcript_60807:60-878(-)
MAAARDDDAADAMEPPVLRVPGDYPTVPEAAAAAQPGDTIEVGKGEHSWPGKIFVDKAFTVRGFRNRISGFPESFLRGRWQLCIPPPLPWDPDPKTLGKFVDVWCENESGCTINVVGGDWEFDNCRVLCSLGTALSVPRGNVVVLKSTVGASKEIQPAIHGINVGEFGAVSAVQTAVRNCKCGVFMRSSAKLTMEASEVHRVLIALGCILPNQCEVGVFSTRLHQYGALWHQSSRPTWLIQKGNYDEYGNPLHLHGEEDGKHYFQTQDLASR